MLAAGTGGAACPQLDLGQRDREPCVDSQLVGDRASTFRASSKSAAVRPPSEWVETVTVTVSQEIARSGWWFISSAGSTRLWTNAAAPTKSPRLKRFSIASPPRSQPSSFASLSSTSESLSRATPLCCQPSNERAIHQQHRQAGPLADRHLSLCGKGPLGARLQGSRPRPPLAAAGYAHPDCPLPHPRGAADDPDSADGRAGSRRLDRHPRRPRRQIPRPAPLPLDAERSLAGARARGLVRREPRPPHPAAALLR